MATINPTTKTVGYLAEFRVFHQIVELSWLARPSTEVAPDLLGCTLVRLLPDGQNIRGLIVETEAYAPGDPAFHAYRRRTERNSVVFGSPGRSYIYLIYRNRRENSHTVGRRAAEAG